MVVIHNQGAVLLVQLDERLVLRRSPNLYNPHNSGFITNTKLKDPLAWFHLVPFCGIATGIIAIKEIPQIALGYSSRFTFFL